MKAPKTILVGKRVYGLDGVIWLFRSNGDAKIFFANGGKCKHGRKHSCINYCHGRAVGDWIPASPRWLKARRDFERWIEAGEGEIE